MFSQHLCFLLVCSIPNNNLSLFSSHLAKHIETFTSPIMKIHDSLLSFAFLVGIQNVTALPRIFARGEFDLQKTKSSAIQFVESGFENSPLGQSWRVAQPYVPIPYTQPPSDMLASEDAPFNAGRSPTGIPQDDSLMLNLPTVEPSARSSSEEYDEVMF